MILFDSDHLTVLINRNHSQHGVLRKNIDRSLDETFAIPIVAIEEQCRGWLAQIHRLRSIHRQVQAYNRLAELFDFVNEWTVVQLDADSANLYEQLQARRLRIGTQDLKIASIALTNDALLLSANRRDFERVPGLKVENWLE